MAVVVAGYIFKRQRQCSAFSHSGSPGARKCRRALDNRGLAMARDILTQQALAQAMTDMPPFYRSIIPLSSDTHRGLGLASDAPFAFATGSHLVPAIVDEFAAACADLPILFALQGDIPVPVFLTGLVPGRNSFVSPKGMWTGKHVPAYIRRYPFILGEVEGGTPVICIDDKAEVLKSSGDRHLPLFKPDGSATDRLNACIALVTDYAAAAKRTDTMCTLLRDLKLLTPVTIQNKARGGAITGLHSIDNAALNALPDKDYLRLRANETLGAIYAQLISLRAIEHLSRA